MPDILMPAARALPAYTGWFLTGNLDRPSYCGIESAIQSNLVRRHFSAGFIVLPAFNNLKLTAQGAIDAGLMDSVDAAAVAALVPCSHVGLTGGTRGHQE